MKNKPTRIALILTGLIGSVMLLASGSIFASNGAPEVTQYSLGNYHDDGLFGARPAVWMGAYGQLENETVPAEERRVNDALGQKRIAPATGIGVGVAPLFDTHGVLRAGSSHNGSTYLAVGYDITSDLAIDEADTQESKDVNAFSYGIGVNNPTFDIEYMMSVNDGKNGVSAAGVGLTSRF